MKLPWLRRMWKRAKIAVSRARVSFSRASKLWGRSRAMPPYHSKIPRKIVAFKQSARALFGSKVYRRLGEFWPLTPARLRGQDYERYRSELLRALRLAKVRNIAVTGGYGAGKSSFVQSFAEDHEEYNFCFISLATFNGEADKPDASKTSGQQDLAGAVEQRLPRDPIERIEATIVQQLLYSVKDKSIPQTRLKRINHISGSRATIYSILIIVVSVSLFRILGLPESHAALGRQFPIRELMTTPLWLPILLLALVGFWSVRKLLASILNFNIQGISLRGFSLAQPAVASVLHKQLDEIVYLFERNKIDVVLIEDLDRFSDTSPFTRLREINFILNTSPSIKRPVHFVYLIRDDLFSAEDRVKFFDFVLPIVSVINVDNSKQKMMDIMRLRAWDDDDIPGEKLIEDVCYYIDDMRQLIDILNEYDLFRKLVGKNKSLDRNKVFAAVVARCLFPRHYASLLRGEGPIYELITSYKSWATARAQAAQEEAVQLQAELKLQEVGFARAEREFRAIVWMAASEYADPYQLISIEVPGGLRLEYRGFTAADIPSGLDFQSGKVVLHYSNGGVRAVDMSELVGSGKESLGARMAAARTDAVGARKRLVSIRAKQFDNNVFGLSQAVRHSEFKSYVATVSSRLGLAPIGHLVSNGYLGEDYFDYSGFFYEGSVSRWDKGVMLSIKAGELLPINVRVDSATSLVGRLSDADVSEGRGLVAAVVMQIFGSPIAPDKLRITRKAVLSGIESHKERLDELLASVQSTPALSVFVDVLLQENATALLEVIGDGERCSIGPLREKLCGAAISSESARAEKMGEGLATELDAYITELSDASAFLAGIVNASEAKTWMDSNSTWIEEIGEGVTRLEVEALLRLDAISINVHNIRVMAASYGMDWTQRNFSVGDVRAMDRSRLRAKLINPLRPLLEAVLSQDGVIYDGGADIAWAINKVRDDPDVQLQVVKKIDFSLESLEEVDQSLWNDLCLHNRVQGAWGNLKMVVDRLEAASADRCLEQLFDSPMFLESLKNDPNVMVNEDARAISDFVLRLLSLNNSVESGLAKVIGASKLIEEIPGSMAPEIPVVAYAGLVGGLGGTWVSWVFYRVQSIDADLAVRYLVECLNKDPVLKIDVDLQDRVVVEALVHFEDVRLRGLVISSCLPRVLVWSEATADAMIKAMFDLETLDVSLVEVLLSAQVGARIVNAASDELGLLLLSTLVEKKPWAEVKPIVLAAAEGPLPGVNASQDQFALSYTEASRRFAEVLYRVGVVRKPAIRRKTVVLQPSAKF